MPKSKRDKQVSLTKTTKKGKELKNKLVEKIRKSIEDFDNLYLFTAHNMRNNSLKEIREDWKGSRFFFAKNKIMAIALGRDAASEVQKNVHKLSHQLIGQCGLLFTNEPKSYVMEWFTNFSKNEYAKSGFLASKTVTLPAGPLPDFSHSIEPHLRSLGLPTCLQKGVVVLREEHTVCREGNRIKPEEASILKLIGDKMAEFRVSLRCKWSKDGSFEKFKTHKIEKTENMEVEVETKKPDIQDEYIHKKFSPKQPKKQESPISTELEMTVGDNDVDMTISTNNTTPVKQDNEKVSPIKTRAVKRLKPSSPPDSSTMTPTKGEDPSAEYDKNHPRRSMRTPKPIRTKPEESKSSVKKITASAKKELGTPKKTRKIEKQV